jgi:hypothetical protein
MIAPSVRLSAIKKSANGGIPKRAFSVATAAERKTKGATILKIWRTAFSRRASTVSRETGPKAYEERCHQERVKFRDQSIHWFQIERPELCTVTGFEWR